MKSKSVKKVSFIVLFAVIFSAFFTVFNLTVSADDDTKANPSGAYIKYTVNITKKDNGAADWGLAYNFFNIKKIDYVIEEGDVIEYDVYINTDEAGWGHIDANTSTGNLRDTGASDSDGNGIHTGQDLSGSAYGDDPFGEWYHRKLEVGDSDNCVGVTIKQFQIAMHPNNDEPEYQGYALYDNIVITNNGVVKLVVFKDESDWIPEQVKLNHQKDCKAEVECLVFTPEEEQKFIEVAEAKRIEEESKEAARIEAEASKEASREQASIDVSIEASIEEASRTETINEPADSESDDEGGMNTGLIIIIAAAAVVIIVIVVVLIIATGKKKDGKK